MIDRELDELKAVEAIEALKQKPIEALNNLVNKILCIDKTRVLIGVPSNPKIKHFINTDLEKGSENQKERLIVFLNALMQTGGGAITLKIVNEDNTFDVSGIILKFNGEWFAVTKEEMQESFTMVNPDGEPVEMPENIRIVDFIELANIAEV